MTTAQPAMSSGTAVPADTRCLDITVLAGGPGAEREVSLESGRAVHAALERLGHRSTLCDISPEDTRALDIPAHLVFVALHGEFGEDGTVQSLLDERGIPYGGSGTAASRLAMDKVKAKHAFEKSGIPTPRFAHVRTGTSDTRLVKAGLPAVVKPVAAGSSVNTYIVRTEDDIRRRARELVRTYGEALIEAYVDGSELTVGILGDTPLPVCEIRTPREFYDYDAKYVANDTAYTFDMDLPADLLDRVQQMSLRAHHALGCAVFSRVDWMVDRQGEPFVLEVNTIPGFTSHSLLPKAAEKFGLSFDDLCQRIVELSMKAHAPARPRLTN